MSVAKASKRVVLCADDFGLTQSASASIVALTELDAISAASCVADGVYCARYSRELLRASPTLSLGMHFNLTERHDAKLASLTVWMLRTFVFRRVDRMYVEREIMRQLDAFESLFGRPPNFIDGHEHVHQFPVIRELLIERLMRRYGTAVAIRSTVPARPRGAKAGLIASLGGHATRNLIARHNLHTNPDFAGVYNLRGATSFEPWMRKWLSSIGDDGVIMTHPEMPDSGKPARCNEHKFLASEEWLQMRRELNVQLVPFSGRANAA